MRAIRGQLFGGILFLAGAALIALALAPLLLRSPRAPAPAATPTPEPLIPTATTSSSSLAIPAPVSAPSTPSAPIDFAFPPSELWRLGVSIPLEAPSSYDLAALRVGWVMSWNAYTPPAVPPGVAFAQTVRMKGGVLTPNAVALTAIAAANPGATWLISNESDVRWQDSVTPEVYARLYYEAYTAIKAGDPVAVVAAGGIAQPTPLRFRYLDLVLEAYVQAYGEPMPAQAWHIHNYMLREERDSWGVDIPPGLPDDTGVLHEIDDSGNLEIFRDRILAFRRWMADRGYRGQPLLVSEFGIPMPEDYGFPPERVQAFLRETWRFFLTATDPDLGDPTDGGRLVQAWCWYSIADPIYATGNLVNLESRAWTHLGLAWIRLVE